MNIDPDRELWCSLRSVAEHPNPDLHEYHFFQHAGHGTFIHEAHLLMIKQIISIKKIESLDKSIH